MHAPCVRAIVALAKDGRLVDHNDSVDPRLGARLLRDEVVLYTHEGVKFVGFMPLNITRDLHGFGERPDWAPRPGEYVWRLEAACRVRGGFARGDGGPTRLRPRFFVLHDATLADWADWWDANQTWRIVRVGQVSNLSEDRGG
jgi:hypothetical protein